MNTKGLLVGVTILLLIPIGLAAAAQAGPPEIEVEVIPPAVALPPQDQVQVMVVARNPTTDTLRDVRLSWFTDAPVNVTASPPAASELAPFGILTWTLQIAQHGQVPATGTVHLHVDYAWQSKDLTQAVPRVTLADLQVIPRKPQAVDKIAQVQVQTALDELMEHRPGIVYLIVTNAADTPIQITSVQPSGPDFVIFAPNALSRPIELMPHETHSLSIEVQATDAVRPGRHLLLFQVTFEWQEAGQTYRGSVVASHPIQVGIVGETELLKLVGVPTFLVLPGFLILITLAWLWRSIWPRREWKPDVKTPEFWALAIGLSLVIALVIYPWLTSLIFKRSRSYLAGYGLADITWLWAGSMLIPAVVYLLGAGFGRLGYSSAKWGIARYHEWQARYRPTSEDTPITLLQKLDKQKRGIVLERVEFTQDGQRQRAFLIEPQKGQAMLWVSPAIVVEWLARADQSLQQRVEWQLGPNGNPMQLAQVLTEGMEQRALRVRWKGTTQINAPCEIRAADLQRSLAPRLIIEQE